MKLHFCYIILFALFQVSFSQNIEGKVNGISVWSDTIDRNIDDFDFVTNTNANWVSLQPYGVVWTDSTGVDYDLDTLWECSSFKGLESNISILHQLDISVCLKPHLILGYEKRGAWVGDMKLDTEKKWLTFEESYFKYVSELAVIADSLNVEMFSLGTELGNFPVQRKDFWAKLISHVRTVYHGNLIYCENFDSYEDFPFWDRMDYIGIDAYFNVDVSKTPSIDGCKKKWLPHKEKIKALSEKTGKKVLFTEFGYHSSNYCGLEPFSEKSAKVNLVAQANAYRGLFYSFWYEEWFAGGFSWNWFFDNSKAENYDNTSYTPQNKPAENLIRKFYLEFKTPD